MACAQHMFEFSIKIELIGLASSVIPKRSYSDQSMTREQKEHGLGDMLATQDLF